MKKLLFSITPKDCELQTFTVGGHGGAGKDTSNTGVRWIHAPSGAVGECREERSQLQNKRIAWKRMAESPKMQKWLRHRAAWSNMTQFDVELWVENEMKKVRVEVKNSEGRWVDESV